MHSDVFQPHDNLNNPVHDLKKRHKQQMCGKNNSNFLWISKIYKINLSDAPTKRDITLHFPITTYYWSLLSIIICFLSLTIAVLSYSIVGFPISEIGTIWTLGLLGAAAQGSHPAPLRCGPSASLTPRLESTLSDMTILLKGM